MTEYYEFHCQKCNKLLAKVRGDAEIICPACGGVNSLTFDGKVLKYKSRLRKQPERASSAGKRFN
jgi:phage FluMu protein Com